MRKENQAPIGSHKETGTINNRIVLTNDFNVRSEGIFSVD